MGIDPFGGAPHRHQQADQAQSVGGHFASPQTVGSHVAFLQSSLPQDAP
jgi:hypothetical protein